MASGQSVTGVDAAMQPSSEISGTVTDASTGAAVSGAVVTVYDSSGAIAETAKANTTGAYSVPGLAPGSYRVGFDGSSTGNYQPQYANGEGSLATADPITVTAGQSLTNLDAALQPGGLISGTARDAATHAPLSGVTVTLYDTSGNSHASVRTDASGEYALTGIPAGSYSVAFELTTQGYLPQFASGKDSLDQANPIAVAAGQSITGVDAAMQPGAQISGTITDAATHAPVSGALATVFDSSGAAVGATKTRADGTYTLLGLRPGSYRVGFDASGAGDYEPQYADGTSSLTTAAVTTLGASQAATGVDAELQPGGEISGTVTDASTGASLEGVTVTVYDGKSLPVTMVSTDATGAYTATGLAAGSYTVRFDSEQAGDYLPQSYPGQSPPATGSPVAVTAGQAATGIDAALAPGGSISGTVTDTSTGAPLPRAGIVVYTDAGDFVTWTETDPHGNYVIERLPAGSYKIGFDARGDGNYAPQFSNGKPSLANADPFTVAAGQAVLGVNAAMAAGGKIQGTGTDRSSGALLRGITVTAYDATGTPVAAIDTDASGQYTIDSLETGTYRIGFEGGSAGSYASEYYNNKASLGTADGVAVTAGAASSGIDARLNAAGKADQTITFASTPPSAAVYGGSYMPSAVGGASSNPVVFSVDRSSDPGACSYSLGTVSFTGVGRCVIDADQAGDSNYNAAATVQQSLTIAKKSVHVDATPDQKSYGTADPDVRGDYALRATDFVGLDTAAVASGSASCSLAPHSESAGTYADAITCDPLTLTASNYTFVAGASADLTITKADQTITFASTPPSAAVYGGSYMPSAVGGASSNPVVFSVDRSSDPGACSYSLGTVSFTGVGRCVIDADQAGDSNYNAAATVQQSLTISAAPATVPAGPRSPSAAGGNGRYR